MTKDPDVLSFLITNKCTANCDICCFRCSPENDSFLTTQFMETVIENSVKTGKIKKVGFSGGEPFLAFEQMLYAADAAKKHGCSVVCTSNGFWGYSYASAIEKLQLFKDAGLSKLSLSCDLFHNEYVDVSCWKNIILACNELEIYLDVGSVLTKSKCDLAPILSELSDSLINVPHYRVPCQPIGNAVDRIESSDFFYDELLLNKENKCYELISLITYLDGNVYPCCSQFGRTESLRLGSMSGGDVEKLFESYHANAYIRILKRYGLHWFVDIAKTLGYSSIIDRKYVSKCHLCNTILTDNIFLVKIEPYIAKEKEKKAMHEACLKVGADIFSW